MFDSFCLLAKVKRNRSTASFDTSTLYSINAQLRLQPAPRKWQVVLEMRGGFILSVLVNVKNRIGCVREAGVDEKNRVFHSINERLCKYSDRLG